MPRITRKERAAQLAARVQTGPAFHFYHTETGGQVSARERKIFEAEAAAQYRCWVEGWVIQDLLSLVPELRSK